MNVSYLGSERNYFRDADSLLVPELHIVTVSFSGGWRLKLRTEWPFLFLMTRAACPSKKVLKFLRIVERNVGAAGRFYRIRKVPRGSASRLSRSLIAKGSGQRD
jgi:hypothetical protein